MSRACYRYSFSLTADFTQARASLRLAMLAAEATFGEARVRLDARFTIYHRTQCIDIDASTATGEALNETYTYFLVREMSLGAFLIERIDSSVPNESSDCQCAGVPRSSSHASEGATS